MYDICTIRLCCGGSDLFYFEQFRWLVLDMRPFHLNILVLIWQKIFSEIRLTHCSCSLDGLC